MIEYQMSSVVKAIFDVLYDRAEFDWWWDNIDSETKDELIVALNAAAEKALSENN
jgi:hypothetical protein